MEKVRKNKLAACQSVLSCTVFSTTNTILDNSDKLLLTHKAVTSPPREIPYITNKQKRDTQQHAHTAAAKSAQHDAGRWKILTPYGREASFGSGGFKPEHLTAL